MTSLHDNSFDLNGDWEMIDLANPDQVENDR